MTDTTSSNGGVLDTIDQYVWQPPPDASSWRLRGSRSLQVIWAVGRDLAEGQITLRAMSLVYTTLLSLVPLLAISFSILKGFGVHNQVEPLLRTTLEPLGDRRDEVVDRIIAFVDNIEVGVLGSVGFLLLFYAVVSLMQKIELAFNDVWQITRTRTFAERFKDYLSVIIIGPVLVFSSIGITATVMSDPFMASIVSVQPLATIAEIIGRLIPISMVVLAFTFIYMFIPYTRVKVRAAFIGGLVAGVLWNMLGWVFAAFASGANNYATIYSGFATPILFMIWLYVGWLILLVGATIAFYAQHPEYLPGRQIKASLSFDETLHLTLEVARLIGARYYEGHSPPDEQYLGQQLRVPSRVVEQLVEPLTERQIVAAATEPTAGYLPGRPWETTTVHDLLAAATQARTGRISRRDATRSEVVARILERREQLFREAFGEMSLKELAGALVEEDSRRA